MMSIDEPYTLDEELESWKGFPWALREEDQEIWERMIAKVRSYEGAIRASGRWLTTEPFFMALLFLQYKTVRSLEEKAERLRDLAAVTERSRSKPTKSAKVKPDGLGATVSSQTVTGGERSNGSRAGDVPSLAEELD